MYRYRRTQLAYEKLTKAKGCAFCNLDDRTLNPQPRSIVQQTAHMLITPNAFPYDFCEQLTVDEHLLLMPIRHLTSMNDLTAAERKDFMDIVCNYESRGYSVYSRSPDNIVRSVAHIHTHLIKTSGKRPRGFLTTQKPYVVVSW